MKPAKIIAMFFFLCYGTQAYSQTHSFVPEWSYGINGGVTFSRVGFNSYMSVPQDLLRQFSGGITVRYISERNFGIQGELNYSLRGWKERVDTDEMDTIHVNRYARSIAYLELPVLTHIYFNLGKSVRLIFNLGPQISYYISEKEDNKNQIIKTPDPDYYTYNVQHSFDYGLKGAMGLEFRTKAGSFILDGRYYFGLSDIFNNSKADLFQASHNQVLGVNLTYLFHLKKKS
jgi:hypothetical protein